MGRWEFLSKCYIHGIMDGEMVKDLKSIDLETFSIA